jgi:hypothetical protein
MASQVVIRMESKIDGLNFDHVSVDLFSERYEMWEISEKELSKILSGDELVINDEGETYIFTLEN